ncbi:MAG: VOC family protein [Ilumatobacteraceae bacterium]
MTVDPFERLRPADPAPPDARFVNRLRQRLEAALDLGDVPIIDLPERTTTMTDTTTATITPYLCVSPAGDAIDWYRDHLGAAETIRYTGDDGRVGHAEISIGGAMVMLSDEYPELEVVSPTTLGGTPTTLHVTVPDVDATYERVTAGGARIAHPPKDEAYGFRGFSMVDPFGHRWMIQTPTGNPSLEEIQDQVDDYTITTPDDR